MTEMNATPRSGEGLMREWLSRPLFDQVPEGIPDLQPEKDDEDDDDAD